MKPRLLAVAALLAAPSIFAATYIVPSDRAMVHRADAIVIVSALASYSTLDQNNAIETVSTFSVEEVIKGNIGGSLEVREPGGTYGNRSTIIGGVPRFRNGERYLLFLLNTKGGWRVIDLALGKFSFATDGAGKKVVLRDEPDIAGWDPDGQVHREVPRSEPEFLEFLRIEARGGMAKMNYVLSADEPSTTTSTTTTAVTPTGTRRFTPAPSATFSPTTYLMLISGNLGSRWTVFPSAVSFFSVGTEPGAPGGGSTAITTAIASWNNDPNSNVNYVYAGADNGTHNSGLNAPDGANTVSFERDLSARGIPPFSCSGNGYSGTLGIGGITDASGTHTGPAGETFVTTLEGDVEMNKGLANCTLLFNSGDFNSAVTHEIGHTLGFRHSDQDRNGGACPATIECSTTAIMKSFITQGINAALQPWDQHAVDAVYPGTDGGTVPPAPAALSATAQTSTSVLVQWSVVTGATSYQVFRRGPGGSFAQITTTTSTTFTNTGLSPNTSYLYKARAVNSAGASSDSPSDVGTTVIFTDDPLVAGSTVIKAVHLAELRTAVNAVRALAGMGAASFTDPATPGVVVKAVHINELRSDLDPALQALGLNALAGGYTNSLAAGVVIKAVDFQEIRNKVR
jgi:hypothetical protein